MWARSTPTTKKGANGLTHPIRTKTSCMASDKHDFVSQSKRNKSISLLSNDNDDDNNNNNAKPAVFLTHLVVLSLSFAFELFIRAMSPVRTVIANDGMSISSQRSRARAAEQASHRSTSSVRGDSPRSQPRRLESQASHRSATKDDRDDCFGRLGLVSSSEEKNEGVVAQDQPAHAVEEIDAITALMLYDTYARKHEFTFSSQHRVSPIEPRQISTIDG